MAYAKRPLTFAQAVVAVAGTAVAPSAPIPDNCVAVTILNIGANPALIGLAAPGAGALTEGTNATRILAGGAFTLPLGALGERGIMDQTQLAGSGIVYDGVGGVTTLDITYQNYLSQPG